MKVVFTDAAEADLEAIGDAIAKDRQRRAVSFVAELREKCESLAALPEAFPVVRRYRAVQIRRRVHGSYLIFYRVKQDRIVILHVLHGAMNYDEFLVLGLGDA